MLKLYLTEMNLCDGLSDVLFVHYFFQTKGHNFITMASIYRYPITKLIQIIHYLSRRELACIKPDSSS